MYSYKNSAYIPTFLCINYLHTHTHTHTHTRTLYPPPHAHTCTHTPPPSPHTCTCLPLRNLWMLRSTVTLRMIQTKRATPVAGEAGGRGPKRNCGRLQSNLYYRAEMLLWVTIQYKRVNRTWSHTHFATDKGLHGQNVLHSLYVCTAVLQCSAIFVLNLWAQQEWVCILLFIIYTWSTLSHTHTYTHKGTQNSVTPIPPSLPTHWKES